MTVYAYARVSTPDQHLDGQLMALRNAGCERIFQDHGAGGLSSKRVQLQAVLEAVQPGDTLIVWRLDRLARSMFELVNIVMDLHERGVAFRSLCEHIDVNSAFGELVLHILSAIAHFERALIVKRTVAGMQAARARGVQFGRRPVMDSEAVQEAQCLLRDGLSVEQAASEMGVGRSTLYRYMAGARQGDSAGKQIECV